MSLCDTDRPPTTTCARDFDDFGVRRDRPVWHNAMDMPNTYKNETTTTTMSVLRTRTSASASCFEN
eukprot:1183212-Pyramimonas_sp.AAC.1